MRERQTPNKTGTGPQATPRGPGCTSQASRRSFLAKGSAFAVAATAPMGAALALSGQARAQEIIFFQIGTGSTGGTYFPVGGLIASVISHPPGSRPCDKGGSCGYDGLIGVAVSTEGSVSNVAGISNGNLQSGLCQADIAHWAFSGTGLYADIGRQEKLRSVANLFPEMAHLVVRRSANIRTVEELRGRRVSLDIEGSGTRVDARLLLSAYGLKPEDLDVVNINVDAAVDEMRAGELDGFFLIAGTPTKAVSDLAEDGLITLVPIDGPAAEALQEDVPFFSPATIPSWTYKGVAATQTLAVGAQWLVSAEIPEDIVYQSTFALWHANARRVLDNGHPKAALIQLDTALDGLGVPLHPGAARYYREIGLFETIDLDAIGTETQNDDGPADEATPAETEGTDEGATETQ